MMQEADQVGVSRAAVMASIEVRARLKDPLLEPGRLADTDTVF